jgi:hypothetical protein
LAARLPIAAAILPDPMMLTALMSILRPERVRCGSVPKTKE